MTKEKKEQLIRHLKYNLEIGADYLITDEDAVEIIKALEQTRWIPISERLPKTDEDVLVTNGRGMYIGWIDATDKGWRVDSESEYFMDDIVAWMPLPQPYKAESEE